MFCFIKNTEIPKNTDRYFGISLYYRPKTDIDIYGNTTHEHQYEQKKLIFSARNPQTSDDYFSQ
jgi:hypothetical protein